MDNIEQEYFVKNCERCVAEVKTSNTSPVDDQTIKLVQINVPVTGRLIPLITVN